MVQRARFLPLAATPLAWLPAGCGAGVAGVAAAAGDDEGGNSPPLIANLRVESTKRAPALIEFDLVNGRARVELLYTTESAVPGSGPRRMQGVAGIPGNPVELEPGTTSLTWNFTDEEDIPEDGSFVEGSVVLRIESAAEARRDVGLTSAGSRALLVTAGDSLLLLDYRAPAAPRLGRLRTGLATPWGVDCDPRGNLAYVAERDGDAGRGRFAAIELDSHAIRPLSIGSTAFERPEALAVERGADRILAILRETGTETRRLVGIPLDATSGGEPYPIGGVLGSGASAIGTGPSGLVVVAGGPDGLVAGGGIEQENVIAVHTGEGRVVLRDPLELPVRPNQPWRLSPAGLQRGRPGGARGAFLWDSSDARGEPAFLRIVARDAEDGPATETEFPKSVAHAWSDPPFEFISADRPTGIRAADLDEDGDLDVASSNSDGDDLTVFFRSSGAFGNVPNLRLGGPTVMDSPSAIVAADLDADEDLDLACSNTGSDELAIFHQVAPGVFASQPLRLTGVPDPAALTAADLDGDGDQDLASADRTSLSVFFQDEDGFRTPALTLGGTTTRQPFDLRASDLDGDGDLDLVSANNQSNTLTVFSQEGAGQFSTQPFVLGFQERKGPASVAAGDLDLDGAQDLVSANFNSGDLTVFFQRAEGGFDLQPLVVGAPDTGDFASSVQVADLDDDGDLELLSGFAQVNRLAVFFQTAPREFESPALVVGTGASIGPEFVVADVTQDGRPDLLTANSGSDTLSLFAHATPGRFAAHAQALGDVSFRRPFSLAAADLDEDGDLDLASANSGSDNLAVFLQGAPGAYPSRPLALEVPATFLGSDPFAIAAADLDGDARLDLVSANFSRSDLTLFFQRELGVFDPAFLELDLPPFSGLNDVMAADLDGDGDNDLACTNNTNVVLFFQIPSGAFPAPPVFLGRSPVIAPRAVEAADLDGDGDLDLVSANQSDVTLFFQGQTGTFGPDPASLGGPASVFAPVAAVPADVDGDGDLDLACANGSRRNLAVLFQSDPGVFEGQPLVLAIPGAPSDGPLSVVCSDLDGDGDGDLASANGMDHELTIFWQRHPGSFDPRFAVLGNETLTTHPVALAATDLDGDGDVDLASCNADDLTLFWGGR
jgi:hypothetical protein